MGFYDVIYNDRERQSVKRQVEVLNTVWAYIYSTLLRERRIALQRAIEALYRAGNM